MKSLYRVTVDGIQRYVEAETLNDVLAGLNWDGDETYLRVEHVVRVNDVEWSDPTPAPLPEPEPDPEPPILDPVQVVDHVKPHGVVIPVPDHSFSEERWTLQEGASFDRTMSRYEGESSLRTSVWPAKGAISANFDVPESGYYQVKFWVTSDEAPCLYGCQTKHSGGTSSYNQGGMSYGTVSARDEWEEASLIQYWDREKGPRVSVHLYKRYSPVGGDVWFSDVRVNRIDRWDRPGFEDPPNQKRAFESSPGGTMVDPLGNFEFHNEPWFMWGMHTRGSRADWSIYRDQGWNTNMWVTSPARAEKSVEAGLQYLFQFQPYVRNTGVRYLNPALLKEHLDQIVADGNDTEMVGFWWDNEKSHDEWLSQVEMCNWVHQNTPYPILTLEGNYAVSRHRTRLGMTDVVGTYHGGSPNDPTALTSQQHWMLDRMPHQLSPAGFAQINGCQNHVYELRMRVFNALLSGCRGISYYGDGLSPEPPIENAAWEPDIRSLTSQVNELLPLIRWPHWTEGWGAKCSSPDVNIGTRMYGNRKMIWLVNQTDSDIPVDVQLEGTSERAAADWYDGSSWAFANGRFEVTVPKLGGGTGHRIIELVG